MITVISLLASLYFAAASAYLLFFAAASFLGRRAPIVRADREGRFLILLPVYKEDAVILDSARKAMALRYNPKKLDVCVIADSLQGVTHQALRDMGCVVIRMDLTPRSKAKAINLALSQLPADLYDVCLVLDADNHLAADALVQINDCFQAGAKAIQCQRVAKEISTPISALDAISEGINNAIFRKGHRVAGLSAALAGSGMAFEYHFFKEVMSRIDATNGFDKDLEFEVISSGIKIEYLESVPVFDEKVSSLEVLQKQRTRWFAAQVINIRKGFYFFTKSPSLDVLDKWWQMWLPSRLLLLGFMGVVTLTSIVFQKNGFTWLFLVATLGAGLALVLATPRKYIQHNGLTVLAHLPGSFFTLILSLLSMGRARKGFIHTPHQSSKV